MRVGEAVAALGGTELRFDELDGEREEQRREEPWGEGQGETSAGKQESRSGVEGTKGANSKDGTAGSVRERPRSKKKKSKRGSKGRSAALDAEEKRRRHWQSLPASFGGGGGQVVGRGDGDCDSDLDPDMLLPLGGAGSGSDSDDANVGDGNDDTDSEQGSRSTSSGSSTDTEGGGYGGLGGGGFGLDGDDDDALEAYDLWDDQDDLAKVAEPVYLDQLIEMLRSREKPDTADQHETALRCAENLVRRNPPDLAHRAPELSRDLLYLEDSFDLECFETRRSGALVATVAAAPESCSLYLGSEVWGTGATEGTKMQILDVLVQAASELAGWTRPGGGGAGDSDGSHGGHPSSSGGSYPSALLQEARGVTPQGSIRRQQLDSQQQRGPLATHGLSASAVAAAPSARNEGVRDRPGSKEGKSREGTSGGSSRAAKGEGVASVGGTTRRWGYRRGPREQLRRNLFGRLAPVFFYPLAQGMVLRLRESTTTAPSNHGQRRSQEVGRTIAAAAAAASADDAPYTLPSATPLPPPPPSPLFSARLLHCLTCLVELCGNCPATPALAADLLGLAWLLRGPASDSRELRRAVLIAVATGVERSQDGAASGAVQGQQGEFLRWLQACAQGSDGGTRELAGAVLGHSSVQALAYL
ncbi:unnamed protein product [Ectocarpus sp. 8 AP-2014]